MDGLTSSDCDVLFDALDKWEKTDSSAILMGTMLGSMIPHDNTEARAKFEAKVDAEQERAKEAARLRAQRSAIIKAKIVLLKDSLDAEAVTTSR